MKFALVIAAVAFAGPALAQTIPAATADLSHGQPTCATDGSCPRLATEVRRQLGLAADAGIGGPYEAAAPLVSRPATRHYPPCRPGPGDDNCIQLYERGVTGR